MLQFKVQRLSKLAQNIKRLKGASSKILTLFGEDYDYD